MPPAERTQVDGKGDLYSDLTATIIPNDDPQTRQEFKDDADLNILLARFGVDTPMRQGLQYGEVDYQLDLQQALDAIDTAKKANIHAPEELRDKYPDWRSILNGVETGEYQKDLENLKLDRQIAADKQKHEEALKNVMNDAKMRRQAELQLKREAEDRLNRDPEE